MVRIGYMGEEEEEFWGPTVAGVVDDGILLNRRLSSPETVRHEIGHVRYPVEIGEVMAPEYYVEYLFAELCANYYSLSIDPRDSHARGNIRREKSWAREKGLTGDMISRVDSVARGRVGFGAGEVRS